MKKFICLAFISATLLTALPQTAFAESNDSAPNNEVQQVTPDSLHLEDLAPSNSRVSQSDTNGSNFVDSMGTMFDNMGDPASSQGAAKVSQSLGPKVSHILGFIIALVAIWLLLATGIEIACILIKPIRPYFGADGGNGGGLSDGGGGNGKKKVLFQVSEDCLAVLSGSGGSGGGSLSDSGKSGVSSLVVEYLKLRYKTIIYSLIAIALLLTPFGFNLIMMIVEFFFTAFSKLLNLL